MKKIAFNDHWTCNGKAVTLPHDAMLHEKRDPRAACGSAGAFFPGGRYLYEKSFQRPEAGHVLFQFEGVYKNARVFINGREAGGAPYGYIPFFVCADPYLTEGENIIRVECDCTDQPDSRWYSGAGIYRPVWLWEGCADAIEPESIRISTLSYAPARVEVRLKSFAKVEILDGETVVASGDGETVVLEIPDAKLWSDETPYLYECRVTTDADCACEYFGIRRVEWSNEGLFVNGKRTLLRGGCVHHDSGILGAATYDESEYRRVKKLKDAGFNAIRSAHNPCSRAMLDACDRLGVFVMDEAWDMWFHHKSRYDYASEWREHHMSDLAAMVGRDFNHPCVILYSLGNEVSEPAKEEGLDAIRRMTDYLHQSDPNRAVTAGFNLLIISSAKKGKKIYDEADGGNLVVDSGDKKIQGMNSTVFNMITSLMGRGINKGANSKAADAAVTPALELLDIAGYNYASGRYPLEGKAHPSRIVLGSETFPQDIAKNWEMVERYPYLVGDFMWTAWDYLGEAGIGAWIYDQPDSVTFNKPYPWLLADTGAVDILGNPTGELFLASAVWGALKKPAVCVQPLSHKSRPAKAAWRGTNAVPSWSWKGCEGKKAVIEVYYNADKIELQLNGKHVGKAKVKGCLARFKTAYIPGRLTAIAYDAAGKELGRTTLSSANASEIRLLPEKSSARVGEPVYVPVVIADACGVVESNADRRLTVSVEGGELLGFGSANPRTEERFDAGSYTTYYGHALAIVRGNAAGELMLRATDGQKEARVRIEIK